MQDKIEAVKVLIEEAKDEFTNGGTETPDGILHTGFVDFDELRDRVICVLEDREWEPPKREILPNTIIHPVSEPHGMVNINSLPLKED